MRTIKICRTQEAEEATQAQQGRKLSPCLADLLANQALLAPRLTDTDVLVAKCPIRSNGSGRPCGNGVVVVVFVGSSHPDHSKLFAARQKIFSFFFVVLRLKGICATAVCVWHGGNNIALLSSLSPALESTLNLLIGAKKKQKNKPCAVSLSLQVYLLICAQTAAGRSRTN